MMKHYIPVLSLTLLSALITPLSAQLKIKDTEGKSLDILAGERALVRYMYEYDTSSDQTKHATYKPYLHVFDADGKSLITKGPGGQFTHHLSLIHI